MYELIIIGGGPAGTAAGVYAARKKMKVLLITAEWGGQSNVSADIQNWIGTKNVSGIELAQMFEGHVKAQEAAEVHEPDKVTKIEARSEGGFVVSTEGGKSFEGKHVLICSGSLRRKLGIPGEKEFDGRGVAYCATCDAPLFSGKEVVVVGGGNSGLESSVDLLPYASKITLLEFGEEPKGDLITLERLKKDSKFELVTMAQTKEVHGDKFVTGITYTDRNSNEDKHLDVGGVFVEIGMIPNTEFLGDLVEKNKYGEIVVDHKTQATSRPGVWAAGDASDVLYKQNNISAGDAVKAILSIYGALNKEKDEEHTN